jgi:hypothetical protein
VPRALGCWLGCWWLVGWAFCTDPDFHQDDNVWVWCFGVLLVVRGPESPIPSGQAEFRMTVSLPGTGAVTC